MNWRKLIKYTGVSIASVVLAAIGFAAYLIYLFVSYEDVELGRFPNPSASLDAVIVERLANATAPQITFVSIVRKNARVDDDNVFFGNFVEGMKVKWIDDRTLLIHAGRARIVRQRNEVHLEGADKENVKITYEILNTEQ